MDILRYQANFVKFNKNLATYSILLCEIYLKKI